MTTRRPRRGATLPSNPSVRAVRACSRCKGGSWRGDARKRDKGAQSRGARRTSIPVHGALAAPLSVSAGRRRPKVAVTDGREKARGSIETCRGQTDEEEHEREDGNNRGRARREKRQKRYHRKAVCQCRTLFPWNRTEPRTELTKHREIGVPSVIGPWAGQEAARRGAGAGTGRGREGKSETRRTFSFSLSVLTRAALGPCVVLSACSRDIVSAHPRVRWINREELSV